MKYVRILLIVAVSLALVGMVGWLFIGWSINQAFKPALKEGGGLRQLSDVLEGSIGSTLARGDARLKMGEAVGEGALVYYQKNAHELQLDKKYFETWRSALSIADAARRSNHDLGQWETSTEASWISPSQKADAWGHAFCVQSGPHVITIVSAGPQAISSLDCKTLNITAEELARMPQARLNPRPSGALMLFVRKSVSTSTGKGAERSRKVVPNA
jgi:hypothetical protein